MGKRVGSNGNREKGGTLLSFGYPQMIVRLYPNDCLAIRNLKCFSGHLLHNL